LNQQNHAIVKAALEAANSEEADGVQQLISMSFAAEHIRPLGDKPNNFGTLASAADYDLKLVEAVTNMQDAVVDRAALEKYGSRAAASAALTDPRMAADELFAGEDYKTLANAAQVTFLESDPPTATTKKFTAVFRDLGTGISNAQVPRTIFGLGGSYKEDAMYLQGAFGLGGELTYRNAEHVILVTRKAPKLLEPGEADVITVAVVDWRKLTKVESAYYLVDREWNAPGDIANPWNCPAVDYPDFEPGTHLALISYRTTGLHRQREGDARSFDTIANTRLVRPIIPVRWTNYLSRGDDRSTYLRGLNARLDNTKHKFPRESTTMPFLYLGKPYMLDVSYTLFNEPTEDGKRATFVAYDHAVLFTSNGQVQTHWTPAEFKARTKQKKLDQRVLIEVDLDNLPIEARTSLFTADRAGTVKSAFALALEEQVAAFISAWDSLSDENRLAVEKQLKSTSAVSTRNVSDRIRRAFAVRGFGGSAAGGVTGGGSGLGGATSGGSHPGKRKTVELKSDPTIIEGPSTVHLEIGATKFLSFTIDANDEFFEASRGEIVASAPGAPFKLASAVALGKPSKGRFRVSIAVPEGLDPSEFLLTLTLADWTRSSGGLGETISFECSVHLVDEMPGKGSGGGAKPTGGAGTGGTTSGSNVVMLWSTPDRRSDWNPGTVGEVEDVEAQSVAKNNPEYADLAPMGSAIIQCIFLNSEFPGLATYLQGRAQDIKANSVEMVKARYAIGIGVEMLVLADEFTKLERKNPAGVPAGYLEAAHRAAARGVLAVLPEFDQLAKAYADEE
jgi:hypothetical protein